MFNPLCSPYYFGYDTSFEKIPREKFSNNIPAININFNDIVRDKKNNQIHLQENQYLDFGGFLKGYLSDLASKMLSHYPGNIINLGGDITTRGYDKDGKKFIFSIMNPFDIEQTIGTLELHNLSLATSSSLKRNWKVNNTQYHHIIDPRNLTSTENNIASLSVVAPTGSDADALTTAGYILGIEKGLEFLSMKNIPALYIDMNLHLHMNPLMKHIFTPLI